MKTILIIDDNAQYRRVSSQILQVQGWRVLEAGDGEVGLDMVRQYRPHIVLCDLLMPRCNGFQVCRAIRSDATLRHTKIIVTSGRDFDADRKAAREAGADEYLTKPILSESLIHTIKQILSSTTTFEGKPSAPTIDPKLPAQFKFWGVRGSIPSPGPDTVQFGGNTTCLEVRTGGEIIILDGGTGLRLLGRSLIKEFKDKPLNLTLLLTHTHWDHIQGLPFFLPIYQPQCRLRILGFEGARKGLVNVLSSQMESPYFPVPFVELPGNIEIEELKELSFRIGPIRVEASFANHPGICVGYRLFTDDGSFAFFPDNEPYVRHRETATLRRADMDTTIEYARDEENKMIEFLKGADALILDSQYDRDEYPSHVGWGHGCVDDTVGMALRAETKKLFLFHHDPDHNDEKVSSMEKYAQKLVADRKSSMEVVAAREGEIVKLAAISGKKA